MTQLPGGKGISCPTHHLVWFTKYIRQTLVLMRNSPLQFLFFRRFLPVLTKSSFRREDWALGNNFEIFLLSRSATGEATHIYQFITNNHASFHLCWKDNLLSHQKLSKYYEHDCLKNFLLLLMSLLIALIVKNSHILGWNLFYLSKKRSRPNWKAFNTKFGPQWKDRERIRESTTNFSVFCKLVALTLA